MDSYIRSPNEALYDYIYLPPPSREIVFLMSISTRYWNATSSAHTAHHRWTACTTRPSHYTLAKKRGGGKLVKTYTCLRNICTHTPQPLSRADRRGGEMYGTVQRTSSAGRTFQSLPYMFTCIYILLYFTNNKIKYPPPPHIVS